MAKYLLPLSGAALLLGVVAVACGTNAVEGDPQLDGGLPDQDAARDSGSPTPDAGPRPTPGTPSFVIAGQVTGLTGTGLVLQNSGGDDLSVNANGQFAFKTKIETGKSFNVAIKTQPTAPSQVCTVSGATGTVVAANVTTVVVNCATNTFTVGGTVSGLAGTGLVIQNNNGDDATIGADGSFAFPTPVADGAPYAVTVKTQPSNLAQTCTVGSGSGTVAGGNVTAVTLTCVTNQYTIGGTVVGLAGSGLVLQHNAGDDLSIGANGAFTFATSQNDGSAFAVTVKTSPTSPQQNCAVSGGSGTIAGGNVSSVVVNCATDKFVVSGTITGLDGSGLVLQNNGGDDVAVNADGTFAFSSLVDDLAAYSITVKTQPTNKWQTCAVTNGSGNVATANVSNIAISCTTNSYKVKGTVIGLDGAGLVLQNNAADDTAISANGPFEFTTPVTSGSGYLVSTLTNPTGKSQTCTVTTGSGTMAGSDIADVLVTCATNHYTVGGTVTGLAAGNEVVLQNNGGDDLTVNADGTFTFGGSLESGQDFAVSVLTQPSSPSQTCTVSGNTGTVTAGNVVSVSVNCTTNKYTVGGTISGLAGSGLVLQNNAGSDLPINANGTFAFPVQDDGTPYAVTVKTQPTANSQTCTVSNGTGNLAGSDVAAVAIACTTNTYSVGGSLSNLGASSIVLTNNGVDDLTLSANGNFAFATTIASGASYTVAIKTQPVGQTCTVTNASGTVTSSAITNVSVSCGCEVGYLNSGGLCILPPTGGAITNFGGYRIHTFASSNTLVLPSGVTVEYLIVAGGGGGGSGDGAGGGAGGVLTGSTFQTGSFPIVVGTGGAGAGTGELGTSSVNGNNSSFASLIAIGGGRGGQEGRYDNVPDPLNVGGNGGSGGGFGGANPLSNGSPGQGTPGQGYAGGIRGATQATRVGMGGGGGAGGVGGNGTEGNAGGAGGPGILSSISGTPTFYAGGGGGSGRVSNGGAGGVGGGGNGGLNASGTNGTANTGGGGGGGGDQNRTGGNGGSGIVIIRYPVTP